MIDRIINFFMDVFFIDNGRVHKKIFIDKTLHYEKTIKWFFLDRVLVACEYDKYLQKDIKDFKYRYNEPLEILFSSYLKELCEKSISDKDINKYNLCLVPEDIYSKIFKKKNHLELISKHLSKDLGIEEKRFVKKLRKTKSQSWLSKEDRAWNVKWAYMLDIRHKEILKWKRILLLDDVISTWSTANEVAKILKENGAKEVVGIFLATWI